MTRSEHEIKQNSRRILINWYPDGEDGGPRHSVIKRLDQVNGIVLPAEVSFSNWHGYHSPQQARRHIAEVRVVLDVDLSHACCQRDVHWETGCAINESGIYCSNTAAYRGHGQSCI